MATREENIKKINDELEKLNNEELDKVAGGLIFSRSNGGDVKEKPDVNAQNPAYSNRIFIAM